LGVTDAGPLTSCPSSWPFPRIVVVTTGVQDFLGASEAYNGEDLKAVKNPREVPAHQI